MTDHDDVMPVSIEDLLLENAQLKAALKEHELRLVTLNIEVVHLKRMLFGQKAERVKNVEAQQSLLSLMGELGRRRLADRELPNQRRRALGLPPRHPHHSPGMGQGTGPRACTRSLARNTRDARAAQAARGPKALGADSSCA